MEVKNKHGDSFNFGKTNIVSVVKAVMRIELPKKRLKRKLTERDLEVEKARFREKEWKDSVEGDLRELGIGNWRVVFNDRRR